VISGNIAFNFTNHSTEQHNINLTKQPAMPFTLPTICKIYHHYLTSNTSVNLAILKSTTYSPELNPFLTLSNPSTIPPQTPTLRLKLKYNSILSASLVKKCTGKYALH
jgi:hypothetical protein